MSNQIQKRKMGGPIGVQIFNQDSKIRWDNHLIRDPETGLWHVKDGTWENNQKPITEGGHYSLFSSPLHEGKPTPGEALDAFLEVEQSLIEGL